MAIYRTVHVSFWTDPKVDDDLTPEEKYFFLFLLTNPHTNLCGCYEISMKQMVRETGYNEDTVIRLLRRLEQVHGVIRYDPSTKEVFVLNWGRYNWSKSGDVMAGVAKSVACIKSKEFRQAFSSMGIDPPLTVGGPSPEGGGISDPVSVTVTVTDPKKKGFKAPSLEEIKAYAKEANLDVDCDRFYTYFTTPNDAGQTWIDSKGNRVKNWKQKLLTWARKEPMRPRSQKEQDYYDKWHPRCEREQHDVVMPPELTLDDL